MPEGHEAIVGRVYDIPIDQINVSEHNVRLSDPEKDLDQLAASIKRHGLLQPVVLEGEYGQPPYELISGQRRYLAHERILQAPTIRSIFVGRLSRTEAIIRSLVENLQRAELEFRDTARAVTELFRVLGNEYAVKEATGLSIRRIREHLMIDARASEKMKGYLATRKVSPADVKRCLQAAQDDISKAERLLELIIEFNPTSHQKRRLVAYGSRLPDAAAEEIFDDAIKPHVEERLVVSLTDDVRKALAEATVSLEMESPADLAEKIISEWLTQEGFASEESREA